MKRAVVLTLLLGLWSNAQADRFQEACLADRARLCPETQGQGSVALYQCFRAHALELSRECADRYNAGTARATDFPRACVSDAVRLCTSPWTHMRDTDKCLRTQTSISPACRQHLDTDVEKAGYANPPMMPAATFIREWMDALALMDRGTRGNEQSWNLYVQEAGFVLITYVRDPDKEVRESVLTFKKILGLPVVRDDRIFPTPKKQVDMKALSRTFEQMARAYERLVETKAWDAPSRDEKALLRERYELLFQDDKRLSDPAYTKPVQSIRKWISS